MRKKHISLFHPAVSKRAIKEVAEVLRSKWIGQGGKIDEFEKDLSVAFHFPYIVCVNTSSSAIRLALSIGNVAPGDEVITTALTCTLTNHPILEQFAVPVFADIQENTGNIDPKDIESRITPKTKAILCTHWGGYPADLTELNELAKKYNLVFIEDASEALGSMYKSRYVGTISRFTAFSFQAIQLLTTGEGGALTVRNLHDYKKAKIKRWYGIDRENRKPSKTGYYDFDIEEVGYGYHLNNIAAAIGITNLKRIESRLNHHREIARKYTQELSKISGITLLSQSQDRESSYHFFTILVDHRNAFVAKMKEAHIEVSIVHARNDEYSVFGGKRKDLPNLDTFTSKYICLPTHQFIHLDDVEYIVNTIRSGW